MRILHVTEYCHAGSIGGTERYILDLVRGLAADGIQNTIGWLKPGNSTETLESDGVRIVALPSSPMRVDAPPAAFREIAERLLETEKLDWLHFHTFGLTEAALAKLAKERGLPYAFTYHSPAWTCRRETMLLYGKEPCDGEVRAWRCSACQSQERLGMGPFAGRAAAAASMALGWTALPLGCTSLRRRAAFYYDTARFRREIRSFLADCDLVVSCCDWSGPVLRRNGAREGSIFHCPQGVPNNLAEALRPRPGRAASGLWLETSSARADLLAHSPEGTDAAHHPNESIRRADNREQFIVGYVGRVVEIKGVHILMEGFSRLRADEARLRIVGWDTEHTDSPYARRLQQLAKMDPRIELVPKMSFNDTLAEYQRVSLLAIPSVWMETGPLTLLEAVALGVPAYGSNRIGQLKLLRERGRVVESNTAAGWQQALSEALEQWKQGAWSKRAAGSHVRTMADVAGEMATRYRAIASN